MSLICCASCVEDEDRAGRHEDVEQRDLDQPLPGEAHQLVDAHARQRAAHPHEDEREGERLEQEPEQADDASKLMNAQSATTPMARTLNSTKATISETEERPAALEHPHDQRHEQDQQRHAEHDQQQQTPRPSEPGSSAAGLSVM